MSIHYSSRNQASVALEPQSRSPIEEPVGRGQEPAEDLRKSHLPSECRREVVRRPVTSLRANPRNARTHSDSKSRKSPGVSSQFGFTNPILIDEEGLVLAGHGRLAAAQRLGWAEVPTLTMSGLSAVKKRAYALADNKLAENAGWDVQILGEELKFLSEIEVEFDVSITGFETVEIDRLVDGLDGAVDPREDEIPPVEPEPAARQPAGRSLVARPSSPALRAMPSIRYPTRRCSPAGRPSSSSPIRPTTFGSTAMSAARGKSGIGSSSWLPARCPRTSSRAS